MIKKKIIFFLISVTLFNCSFDHKTGIWDGSKSEERRLAKLEKEQKNTRNSNTFKIFSSDSIYNEEVILKEEVVLSKPIKNLSWKMSGLNYQNFLGNIYLQSADINFLKKKVGKNKLSLSQFTSTPLFYMDNLLLSDDKGTVFYIDQYGELIWKKNIYLKLYKKIHKNLSLSIFNNNIYVSDNIGFIYVLDLATGKTIWVKNHGVPLKSKIKVFNDKIFLINQDNRILCFDIKDGAIIWDIRAISSFIKSQNLLSLAFTQNNSLVASTTSGEIININITNGAVIWSANILSSSAHNTDFFQSSDIVIDKNSIFYSTKSLFFSYDLSSGANNWNEKVSSVSTPIINKKNIFLVTENGYLVILNKNSGKIISSTNILKILKEKHQRTKITGFIMGSGKIYAVTLNGYLLICSAHLGKVESFRKIGQPISSSPIIANGKMFIYTEKSRIFGFN